MTSRLDRLADRIEALTDRAERAKLDSADRLADRGLALADWLEARPNLATALVLGLPIGLVVGGIAAALAYLIA